jgi:hypothetical protein
LYEKYFTNFKVIAMTSAALGYSLLIMTLIVFKFGGKHSTLMNHKSYLNSPYPMAGGEIKLEEGVCMINFGYLWYLIIANIVILTVIISVSYTKIYLKVIRYSCCHNLIHSA